MGTYLASAYGKEKNQTTVAWVNQLRNRQGKCRCVKPKIATWVLLKQSEGETKSEIEGKSVAWGEGGLAFYL